MDPFIAGIDARLKEFREFGHTPTRVLIGRRAWLALAAQVHQQFEPPETVIGQYMEVVGIRDGIEWVVSDVIEPDGYRIQCGEHTVEWVAGPD